MADSTTANKNSNLTNDLFDAMYTIVTGVVAQQNYDITKECRIIEVYLDDKGARTGIYKVKSQDAVYDAYARQGEVYSTGQNVYVQIPNGDFNSQKFIIGLKINTEDEQDIYNQTLQLRRDTLEAIKEIAMDETLTEEQKQQRINEIMEHYYNRSQYLQEQYNIVSENTMHTNELIADHYGIAVEDITNRTKNTVAEIIGEMINDTDNYRLEMEDAYAKIKQAMQEYADKIGADKYAKDAMETVRYAEEINNNL